MLVKAAVELLIRQRWKNAMFEGGAKAIIDSLNGINKHGQHTSMVENVLESVSSINYVPLIVKLMRLA